MANLEIFIETLFNDKGARDAIVALQRIQQRGALVAQTAREGTFPEIPTDYVANINTANSAVQNFQKGIQSLQENLIEQARAILSDVTAIEEYRQKLEDLTRAALTRQAKELEKIGQQEEANRLTAEAAAVTVTEEQAVLQLASAFNTLITQAKYLQQSLGNLVDKDVVSQISNLKDEAAKLTDKLGQVESTSNFGAITGSLKEVTNSLILLRKTQEEAGKTALAQGQEGLAESFAKNVTQIDKEIKLLNQLNKSQIEAEAAAKRQAAAEKQLAAEKARAGQIQSEQILLNTQYTGGIQGLIAELSKEAQTARETAMALFDLGKTEEGLMQINLAGNLDLQADKLTKFAKTTQNTKGALAGLAPTLSNILSPLNKFGFAMFLVTQNMRTMNMVVGTLINTIKAGAARSDVFAAFNAQISKSNVNVQQYTKQIEDTVGGLFPLEDALRLVSRAAISNNNALVQAIPDLINIAKGAAYTSGELDKTGQNFESLVNGIMKGESELIDNANVFIKVGSATDEYARKLGLSNNAQLTAQQRTEALLQAVLKYGDTYKDIGTNLDSATEKVLKFTEGSKELGRAFGQIFSLEIIRGIEAINKLLEEFGLNKVNVDNLTTSFKQLVVMMDLSANLAVNTIVALKETFDEMKNEFKFFGDAARLAWDFINGDKIDFSNVRNFGNDLKELSDGTLKFAGDTKKLADTFINNLALGVEEAEKSAKEFAIQLGLLRDESNNTGNAILSLGNIFNTAFSNVLSTLSNQLSYFGSEQYQLQKDIFANYQDYVDNIVDAEKKKNEQILDLQDELNKDLNNARDKYNEKLLDIESDLADKLSKIESDANKDIINENEDYNKKRENLEEEHQKKLDDILRKYELSRLSAIIDRDARALFEAERRRDEDIKSENDSFGDKLKDLDENHKEELKKIRDQEKEKRDLANDEAEKRRKDAQKQYEKDKKQAEENYKESYDDLIDSFNKQRHAALEDMKKREQDLNDSYKERQFITQAGELQEQFALAQSNAEKSRDFQQTLIDMEQALIDYYNFVGQYNDVGLLPPVSGSGNGTGTGGGTPPAPQIQSPCGRPTTVNIPCPSNGQQYNCPNGEIWTCINGFWRRPLAGDGNVPIASPLAAPGANGITGAQNITNTGFATPQRTQTTIVVSGDNTLEQIFKNISYKAFIEITS